MRAGRFAFIATRPAFFLRSARPPSFHLPAVGSTIEGALKRRFLRVARSSHEIREPFRRIESAILDHAVYGRAAWSGVRARMMRRTRITLAGRRDRRREAEASQRIFDNSTNRSQSIFG